MTVPLNWIRLDREAADVADRLASEGIDAVTARALLAEETRPRTRRVGEAALVILRGVNPSPEAAPEDMISIRIWIDAGRIISVQRRPLQAADDLATAIDAGEGPSGTGDFLVALADLLTDRMQDVVDALDLSLERLEEVDPRTGPGPMRVEITGIRRKIGALRRFIAPQRDALEVLVVEPFDWQTGLQDRRLSETVDRITRLVEQLDEMQLRAAVAQESLSGFIAERLNRTMVLLSVIAGIFMPLSFVTGLFGMNLAGIPFASSGSAFWAVSAVLVAFGAFEFWLFRRLNLL